MNSDLKVLDPIWDTAIVIRDHAAGEIRPQMVDRTEVSADGLLYTSPQKWGEPPMRRAAAAA